MRQLSRLATAAISIGFLTLTLSGLVRAQNDADKLYKTHCVLCHAPDGSGTSPSGKALKAQDLRSELIQKKTDAELAAVITSGKGKMPAFGKKLSDAEINSLIKYVSDLKK